MDWEQPNIAIHILPALPLPLKNWPAIPLSRPTIQSRSVLTFKDPKERMDGTITTFLKFIVKTSISLHDCGQRNLLKDHLQRI